MAKKQLTDVEKLDKICGSREKGKFVRWYCTLEQDRENFKEDMFGKDHARKLETCKLWLLEDKVQEGLKFWTAKTKYANLHKIYMQTINKAMEGDTKAIELAFKYSSNNVLFDDAVDDLNDFFNSTETVKAKKLFQQEKKGGE